MTSLYRESRKARQGQTTLFLGFVSSYDGLVDACAIENWLTGTFPEGGVLDSGGRFAVNPQGAERAGLVTCGLVEVPLLVMAAASHNSSWFRVGGRRDLVLSWEGQEGPELGKALSILAYHEVDFDHQRGALSLPPAFHDYLGPLWRRCRNAPFSVFWGDRQVARPEAHKARFAWCPHDSGSLTVVDRGLDFPLPVAFPGLEVVVWAREPLPGQPWPVCLEWSRPLRRVLGETVVGLRKERAGLSKSRNC